MRITDLKTNRMTNPLGFELDQPRLSFIVSETKAKTLSSMQIRIAKDSAMKSIVCDSGCLEAINTIAWPIPTTLEACTRYYWQVNAVSDQQEEAISEIAWFETAKMGQPWEARWITPDLDKEVHPVVYTIFSVEKPVRRARVYGSGLGVYELYLDENKLGNEYLMPGNNDYDSWIQYQTYEVNELKPGRHKIAFELGNGWYKGRYGLDQHAEHYGDRFACIAEIHLEYEDGSQEMIPTSTSWKACRSQIMESSIYDGECFDATFSDKEEVPVLPVEIGTKRLQARLSPPLVIHEKLKPVEIIRTPAGETVLDMGQNMVGWVSFKTAAPSGTRIELRHGEILQDGNFYQDNLRTSEAKFIYFSDGQSRTVRPRFTFFGFRYVRVEGWPDKINPDDFTGCVIHSAMEETGKIETSDPLINQLFKNVRWGQKGNFLDIPTDCPQRDERMGWTGDAQIFCGTACYNMDVHAFFVKYGHDLAYEQAKCEGSVPHIVPVAGYPHHGSTAWGEAATIIPWQLYLHYGDKRILERQFDSMKDWVDYIRREDMNDGDHKLWQSGYHFGDWLALDGPVDGGVFSGTDPHYIASAYYYFSTWIVAAAARVLGKESLAETYSILARQIRKAIQQEYFTASGKLCVDTQTAHVLALYMNLAPSEYKQQIADRLAEKIALNGHHLDTGFVGTPYLCHVLSDFGYHELANDLLFNRDFPSWIYEVLMGATTVWERWNSVLPDGQISSTGMNSLNHYAYGSIVEWMYKHLAGISPLAESPGFAAFEIAPKPDYRFSSINASLKTPYGLIRSGWQLKQNQLQLDLDIPFMTRAKVVLPDARVDEIRDQLGAFADCTQDGDNVKVSLEAGHYAFDYSLIRPNCKTYSILRSMDELMSNDQTREIVVRYFPEVEERIPFAEERKTLVEVMKSPFIRVPHETIQAMDQELRGLVT